MPSQKTKAVVDANVILRYLLRDSEDLYRKAEEFFEDVFRGKKLAFIRDAVVAEVIYVLEKLYKIGKKEIADVISELLNLRHIKVADKSVLLTALNIYSNRNMDFVDCLIYAYSQIYEVVSFDREVNKCATAIKKVSGQVRSPR